jgi:hypothetical protein
MRDTELELPVVRADKRYFSLNHRGDSKDTWGLVSDITVLEGGTIITLRSIVQVIVRTQIMNNSIIYTLQFAEDQIVLADDYFDTGYMVKKNNERISEMGISITKTV